jgi:hypothetical protein
MLVSHAKVVAAAALFGETVSYSED